MLDGARHVDGSTSVPPAVRTGRLTSIPTRNWCTSTPSASISSSPAAVVSRAHDASPRSCNSTPPPTVASRRRTSTRPSRSPRALSSCSPYRTRSFSADPWPLPAVAQIVVPPSDHRRYGPTSGSSSAGRPTNRRSSRRPRGCATRPRQPASARSAARRSPRTPSGGARHSAPPAIARRRTLAGHAAPRPSSAAPAPRRRRPARGRAPTGTPSDRQRSAATNWSGWVRRPPRTARRRPCRVVQRERPAHQAHRPLPPPAPRPSRSGRRTAGFSLDGRGAEDRGDAHQARASAGAPGGAG